MPHLRPTHEHSYALRSLVTYPHFSYASQNKDEVVHLITRAHPITQVWWMLAIVLLALIPPLILPYANTTILVPNQITFLVLSWYAVLFSSAITRFFVWYFNLGIVTSSKVIDVDIHGIMSSEASTAFLTQIEEITESSKGIGSAVFNYGDVLIQTAGEIPNIEFTNVPRPSLVVQLINSLIKT